MQQRNLKSITSEPYRVLLVDDHPAIRLGLGALINVEPDLEVCGEAADVSDAMDAIRTLQPDIAVVDLALANSSGIDLIKNIQGQVYATPILVLSMQDEALFAERVMRAGAQGFIPKREAIEQVLVAIRAILQGHIYLSDAIASRLLRNTFQGARTGNMDPITSLSDRELEVLQLMGEGRNRREIADALTISVKTVETHRAHLIQKLHLNNMLELTRYALQWMTNLPTYSS